MISSYYLNSAVRRLAAHALVFLTAFALLRPCPAPAGTQAVILETPEGTPLYLLNPDIPMIPASTFKLLTSLAALETLGAGYRFHTMAAYDSATHRLYLKGSGDPLLISEEVSRLAQQVISLCSPDFVTDIMMDTSFFSPDISIPGTGSSQNPYDATTGALCANFNTFHFKWSRTKGYISAEPQTPYLEVFTKEIQKSGLNQGRILLSEPLRVKYAGLLLTAFLNRQKVPVTGGVLEGSFCTDCSPILKFESTFTLDQVLEKLLAYSNNFIANQIMLALGAKRFGPPANLEKGVAALKEFAEKKLGLKGITIAEGSGLSRRNSISARQMIRLLNAFAPYYKLLRQKDNEFYKTGTLSDVRTRAGYFLGEDKRLYPYVIMLNSTAKGYEEILRKLRHKAADASLRKN